MIVDCISDLHGHRPQLEGGELLIVAGDLTASDRYTEYEAFERWIREQEYKKKIVIGGNHDNKLYSTEYFLDFQGSGIFYLCDSGTEFEGLKIWGSPWTRAFQGMNPRCKAFTCETEEELAEKWALIPADVNILVTHSPAFGVLDTVQNRHTGKVEQVGSKTLADGFHLGLYLPKLWVWGHIHEGHGVEKRRSLCENKEHTMVNASHVNEYYQPVNEPVRIIL